MSLALGSYLCVGMAWTLRSRRYGAFPFEHHVAGNILKVDIAQSMICVLHLK